MIRFFIAVASFLALVAMPGRVEAQATINGVPVDEMQRITDAVTSNMPPICVTPPSSDTLMGTAGTATACTPRQDASRRTIIQAKNTVTAADATYSITWDAPFATDPIYADARVYGTASPYLCTITATATGASGKCFQLVATTLPTLTTSLGGLVVSPISNAAAGLSIRVVGRQ